MLGVNELFVLIALVGRRTRLKKEREKEREKRESPTMKGICLAFRTDNST